MKSDLEKQSLTGPQRDAIRFRYILEMCGALQDDSATTFKITSDDATRTWHVECGKIRTYGDCKEEAIYNAIRKAFPGFALW